MIGLRFVQGFLAAAIPLLVLGVTFYFYTPDISDETRAWVESVDARFDEEKMVQLNKLGEVLEESRLENTVSCGQPLLSVGCYKRAPKQDRGTVMERKQVLSEMVLLLPYVASPEPDKFLLHSPWYYGVSVDLLSELQGGGLTIESATFWLNNAIRLINRPSGFFDYLHGLTIYFQVIEAVNLSLGLEQNTLSFADIPQGLVSPKLDAEHLVRMELHYSYRSIQQGFAESDYIPNKQMWLLEYYRRFWQATVAHFESDEKEYWASNPDIDVGWLGIVSRILWNSEMQEGAFMDYFDGVKIVRHAPLILKALDRAYDGAPINNHGVDAPEYWQWYWNEEKLELCLKLSDEFEQTKRVKGAMYCLPHVQKQLDEYNEVLKTP